MTEYIITEEGIGTIRDYVLSAFYKGESKDKIYELLKSEFSIIRSHPYNPQAEREKVLGLLDKKCKVAADNWSNNDSHRDPFNDVRQWIEELREGKDGE